ncbi:MAG: hypothetical protein ACLGXA_24525 [Acidobacteriota bacterium]
MTRPHWSVRKAPGGKWVVRQTGVITTHSFSSWSVAITWLIGQMSKAAVVAVIRRAEESGEYEAIEACLIDCPDMHRKRRRIVQAAWWRGLSVRVEVELEADPRETLLLVKIGRGGAA